MKKACIALAIISAIVLAGCVSSNETYTADGNMVYAISCKLKSADSCIEQAGEICGSLGYMRVSSDGGSLPDVTNQVTQPVMVQRKNTTEPDIPQPDTLQPAQAPASDIRWNQKIYVKCRIGQSQ